VARGNEENDHGKVQEEAQFGRCQHVEKDEAGRDFGDEARQGGARCQEEEIECQEARRGAQDRDPQGGARYRPEGCGRSQNRQEARLRRPQSCQESRCAPQGTQSRRAAQSRGRTPGRTHAGGTKAGGTEPGRVPGAADDAPADHANGAPGHTAAASSHAAHAGGTPGAAPHEPGAPGNATIAAVDAFDVDHLFGAAADADPARRWHVGPVRRPAAAGAQLYAAAAGRPAAVLFAFQPVDAGLGLERHRRRQEGMT